jgi:hypothetical protein
MDVEEFINQLEELKTIQEINSFIQYFGTNEKFSRNVISVLFDKVKRSFLTFEACWWKI